MFVDWDLFVDWHIYLTAFGFSKQFIQKNRHKIKQEKNHSNVLSIFLWVYSPLGPDDQLYVKLFHAHILRVNRVVSDVFLDQALNVSKN